MSIFLFFILNICFKLGFTENSLNCVSKFNDCFNCSVCGEEESNTCDCHWDINHKICKNGLSFSLSSDFFQYFSSCTDDASNAISDKYCGETNLELNDNGEILINIPENDGYYGQNKLYCEYTYNTLDTNDILYTIEYTLTSNDFSELFVYLIIQYNGETSTSGYLSQKEVKRDFENVKQISVLIYFNTKLRSIPFNLKIIRNGNKAKIALYITIGLIFLACLFCGLIVYCLSKKISENARLRQRTLLELAMARQRGEYINEDRESNSNSGEMNILDENRKKIGILFKTILAPKKFNKSFGVKDGNTCTICIEDFIERKSRVSITQCQHVFHYKCISNWLNQNIINPKCPNCNYNLIKDIDDKKLEATKTIEVGRRITTNEVHNLETEEIPDNNRNLNTNENRLITRNVGRNRNNANVQSSRNNLNTNDNQRNGNVVQEIIIENI